MKSGTLWDVTMISQSASDFDCPYELEINGQSVARCAYRTPMDEAVASAQKLANERGCDVRLHFGGKSYDLTPAGQQS